MFGDCEWSQSGLASWALVCFLQQHCSHSASEATVVPLAAPGKPAGHISALCLQAASQTHQQWCKCLFAWQLAGSCFCLSGKSYSLVLKVSWRNWVENCLFSVHISHKEISVLLKLLSLAFQDESMRTGSSDDPRLQDPMKVVHKEQDIITSFAVNQVTSHCFVSLCILHFFCIS